MDIGNYVGYLRKYRDWSYRDLSAKTGISIGYLNDIEHGRSMPSMENVEKIAAAFEMSIPVFFGGADLELSLIERELLIAFRAGDYMAVVRIAASADASA